MMNANVASRPATAMVYGGELLDPATDGSGLVVESATGPLPPGEQRVRVYTGIALTAEAVSLADKWRAARDGTRCDPVHATREQDCYV